MRKICMISALFIVGMMFQSCEKEEINEEIKNVNSLEVNAAYSPEELTTIDSESWYFYFVKKTETINAYDITLDKIFYSENTTTFTYTVKGTEETAQLDSFYLTLNCGDGFLEPDSWTPTQSSKFEDNKLKWNSSISKNGSQQFTVTFHGILELGVIEAIVVRGGVEHRDYVLGPCDSNIYEIKGHVFIDAVGDNGEPDEFYQEGSESGLEGYKVVLEQNGNKTSVYTDANGLYSFNVIPGEQYTISIGNALLNKEYYSPSYENKESFKIPEDLTSYNFDFGYKALTNIMIRDFSNGTVDLTTASAKEWGQAIKTAGKNNSSFTIEKVDDRWTVNELLDEVNNLLPDVYTFDFGNNRIQGALDILTKPIKTDEDYFFQQLLAAELNYVYGRGVVQEGCNPESSDDCRDDEFTLALIKHAEAKVAEGSSAGAQSFSTMAVSSSSFSLSGTSTLLASFNDNGSGGL